jgi:Zn-dependent protease
MRDQSSWSIRICRWAGVEIRLHVLFLLFAAVALFLSATDDAPPSALIWLSLGILLISVALHEFGHAQAAARFGAPVTRLLLAPYGGVAPIRVAPRNSRVELVISLAGPFTNLLICAAACAIVVGQHGRDAVLPLLRPFEPTGLFGEQLAWITVAKLAIWINWTLVLINLIPAFPFDGGQMLRAAILLIWPLCTQKTAVNAVANTAKVTSCLVVLACVFLWGRSPEAAPTWFALTLLGILVFFSANHEQYQPLPEDDLLETLTTDPHAPPGPLGRWVEHRRHEKEQRAIEQAEQDDAEMDAVLERLHQSSLGELSRSDRDLLKRVSQRLRDRDTRPLS